MTAHGVLVYSRGPLPIVIRTMTELMKRLEMLMEPLVLIRMIRTSRGIPPWSVIYQKQIL